MATSDTLSLPSQAGPGGLVPIDGAASRARQLLRLCELADEFIELVVDRDGRVLSMSQGLARRIHRTGSALAPLDVRELLRTEDLAWLQRATHGGDEPRILHFSDLTRGLFSVRCMACSDPAGVRLMGIMASAGDGKYSHQLQEINNELAVTARELSRQRRLLEGMVAQSQAREARLVTDVQDAERVARTDPLTGLANRRLMDEELPRILANCGRHQRPVTLLIVDLDHFKRINDTYGHDIGDFVLVAVATVLKRNTREDDLVVRMGGEEIAVVLPGVASQRAMVLADNLRIKIAGIHIQEHPLRVTACIGAATWSDPAESIPVLLARADAAMYQAKREGRNRCVSVNHWEPT